MYGISGTGNADRQGTGGYSLAGQIWSRRAMAKRNGYYGKEREYFIYGIQDENGNILVPGAYRNRVSVEKANLIFDEMMEFAKYAFNKSHAAAYALVAYQTATGLSGIIRSHTWQH